MLNVMTMNACQTLIVLMASAFPALAQSPAPPPVISPEILPARKVVFRVYAPQAREVQIVGNWFRRGEKPSALEKGADGVWSITVGPLEPDIYSYIFLVDSIQTIDPVNNRTVLSAGRRPLSLVEVLGDTPMPWGKKEVPHGAVHVETYYSKLRQQERTFYVYTPPGYRAGSNTRFPYLILMPGIPGNEADWTNMGLAHRILDNLIADGKGAEMVVLMTTVDFRRAENTSRADNMKEFEPFLLSELIPLFESRYRVRRQPGSRAIAGLSVGGELALSIGLRHPEMFHWVASFSGSIYEKEIAEQFDAFLGRPAEANKSLRLLWIGCGSGDPLSPGNRKLAEILKDKGIRHVFRETDGFHTWLVWRRYLAELLPSLFR